MSATDRSGRIVTFEQETTSGRPWQSPDRPDEREEWLLVAAVVCPSTEADDDHPTVYWYWQREVIP